MVRSLNFKSVMRNWNINWNSIVTSIELNWFNCDSIELNWIVAAIQFNRLRRAAIQFNRLRRAAIQFKFQLNCRLRRAAIQLKISIELSIAKGARTFLHFMLAPRQTLCYLARQCSRSPKKKASLWLRMDINWIELPPSQLTIELKFNWTVDCDGLQFNSIESIELKFNSIDCDGLQFNSISIESIATACNSIQFNWVNCASLL